MFEATLLHSVLLAQLLHIATAHSNGPPVGNTDVCRTMFPGGHGAPAQSSVPPYEFQISQRCYNGFSTLDGRLKVSSDHQMVDKNYFEGFFIQMRSYSGTEDNSYGIFLPVNDNIGDTKVLDCSDQAMNSLGQAKPNNYTSRTFRWSSANDTEQALQLVATVVKEKSVFWTEIKSEVINFDDSCATSGFLQQLSCEYLTCGVNNIQPRIMLLVFSAVTLWHRL